MPHSTLLNSSCQQPLFSPYRRAFASMLVSMLWCVQALGVCVCMFTSASVEVKLGFAQEDINLAAVFSLIIPVFPLLVVVPILSLEGGPGQTLLPFRV